MARKVIQKTNLINKTILIVASAQHLPFKKKLFDYVTAISVLEHLKNQNSCLRSVSHILKPHGHFFFVVPNSYQLLPIYLRPIKKYLDTKIGHLRTYSKTNITRLAKLHNFSVRQIYYNGHLIKIFQIIMSKLKLINKKIWWYIEKKDITKNVHGAQTNILFQKL